MKFQENFQKNMMMKSVALLLCFGAVACTGSGNNEPANTVHTTAIAKIKGIDPIMSDDLYSGLEVSRGYETLLQYAYLKRPYVLEPSLAESMPTLSADHLTYTFKLKKGVLFQDDPCFKATGGKGREMTADDIIYSWKRVADTRLVSPGWWIFDGKIAGFNEWRDAQSKADHTDYSAPVEGLKAPDPYTLVVKLTKPSALFMYSIAQQFASVVPHEAVEAYGREFQNHCVGTGPFRLKTFEGQSKLVWVKNPTYRKEFYPSEGTPEQKALGLLDDAGKQLPLADMVVDTVFEESQPLWLNFMRGKLEYIMVPKDNFAQAVTKDHQPTEEIKAKGMKLIISSMADVTHLSFNMEDPILGKNKYLRQAMSMATNMTQFISIFYNNMAISAQGPIPPGIKGYDPNLKNPYKQFSVEKAKELMKKAGYPNGEGLPPLEMAGLSDTVNRQIDEYQIRQFAAIGIKIKLDAYSWPEFQEAIKNKKSQLFAWAWAGDYPDAEDFLQLFYGKNVSPGSNDANYSNPEYDKLYEKSLTLQDSPERTAIYQKMVAILVEDTPWIFQAHRLRIDLAQPWMKNYSYNDFDLTAIKYYRIDTALKK